MSTSDQAYELRRHTGCRAEPGRVGHLGYRLTPAGGLQEIGPKRCPRGHDLVYGRVMVKWDSHCRVYICGECGAEMLYCACKGVEFAAGRTEPVECETEWPG